MRGFYIVAWCSLSLRRSALSGSQKVVQPLSLALVERKTSPEIWPTETSMNVRQFWLESRGFTCHFLALISELNLSPIKTKKVHIRGYLFHWSMEKKKCIFPTAPNVSLILWGNWSVHTLPTSWRVGPCARWAHSNFSRVSDKVSPIFQQNRLSLCNSASHVLRDICFSGKQTGTGLWQIKDLVKTLEPYCFRRYSSQLFENDQGGLWRLLWEVHLKEAVHQPREVQVVLEDQSEKQAKSRTPTTGGSWTRGKKSQAGRWLL